MVAQQQTNDIEDNRLSFFSRTEPRICLSPDWTQADAKDWYKMKVSNCFKQD